MADSHRTTRNPSIANRRTLLAGAAALLPLGTVAAADQPANLPLEVSAPDANAEIVATAERMIETYREQCRLEAPWWSTTDEPPPEVQARLDELGDKVQELHDALCEMQAGTPTGWRAKARAMLVMLAPGLLCGAPDGPSAGSDDLLAWSLVRDLLGPDMPAGAMVRT